MRRVRTLIRMALHELWISFQLIAVFGLPVVGGVAVILLPPEFAGETAVAGAGFWYGVGAGAAICIASGLAAWTMARERLRGTLAWMAVRAVPRSAVLASWFVAFGVLLAAGIALGSVGAWLAAVGRAETPPDPAPFISAVGATMAAALASVAAGLLLGTLLPRVPATVLAVALGAGMLAVSVLLRPSPLTGLTGGLGLLAHLDAVARPLATALQSAGTALAAAAALLVLAGMGLERSDL